MESLKLANETFAQIISYIYDSGTLHSLMRCSRNFHDITVPFFEERCTVKNGEKLLLLIRWLHDRPSLAKKVRYLEIGDCCDRCSAVKRSNKIAKKEQVFSAFERYFSNVDDMSLLKRVLAVALELCSQDELVLSLLAALPNLEELNLTLPAYLHSSAINLYRSGFKRLRCPLRRVKYVTLKDYGRPLGDLVLNIFPWVSSMRSLTLENCGFNHNWQNSEPVQDLAGKLPLVEELNIMNCDIQPGVVTTLASLCGRLTRLRIHNTGHKVICDYFIQDSIRRHKDSLTFLDLDVHWQNYFFRSLHSYSNLTNLRLNIEYLYRLDSRSCEENNLAPLLPSRLESLTLTRIEQRHILALSGFGKACAGNFLRFIILQGPALGSTNPKHEQAVGRLCNSFAKGRMTLHYVIDESIYFRRGENAKTEQRQRWHVPVPHG